MSAFSTQFATASDQLFSTFGRSATYTTTAGVTSSVTVRGRATPQAQTSDLSDWVAKASEIASPEVGATLTIDSIVYRIELAEPANGGNWRLVCSGKFAAKATEASIA